jgi:predicted amidohydrolase
VKFESGLVKSSVVSNATAKHAQLEQACVINSKLNRIRGKNCVVYNVVDHASIEVEDCFLVDVFHPSRGGIRLKMQIGMEKEDKEKWWYSRLPENDFSLSEIADMMSDVSEYEMEVTKKKFEDVAEIPVERPCTNIHIPRIQTVHISETQKEIVRIAVVQFCFELTESFPFAIKNKDELKTKIFSALDIAKEDSANIVCLPELCLCEGWISNIKEIYPDMIVIGGSFYKDDKNISPVIMESDVDIPCQPKITPSASEDSGIMESRMIPGDGVNRYETQFGRFVILICRDFDNLVHYFRNVPEIDMIFCPAFNSATERFHKEADVHVEKIPTYVLIANAGLYGGTSIFGRLNRSYFRALVDGGCKDAGDLSYKLCEVKKGREEVIIADFNLIHKSVQVPTPSDPNEEIRSVENIKKIPIQPKQ